MLMMLLISSTMLMLSSAMMLSMNPLTMGIIILSISLMLTLMYSHMLTSWIAFLIFLIYIGGMLVMFTYFVALTPNQQTNMMARPMILMFFSSTLIMMYTKNYPMAPLSSKYMYAFYQMNNIQFLLILALILLFTMVVVVKLVMNNKGPLRPFMN